MVNKYQQAEADRANYKSSIEIIKDELSSNNTTPLSKAAVDVLLEQIEGIIPHLSPNNATLITNAPSGADVAAMQTEFSYLTKLSFRIISGLRTLKSAFPSSARTSATSTPHPTQVRLPTIELPNFNGNLQEWAAFRDMFTTAVGANAGLTNAQKLTYLKTCLSGEASRHVRSLSLTDTNYDIAWTALNSRYQNDRELLFHILKRFFNQSVVSNGHISIRSLIDTSKECTRQLEALSLPVQHWDAILLFTIFQKLDQSSKELWEQQLDNTDIPTLDNLYAFMEQRARALATSSSSKKPDGNIAPYQFARKVQTHHNQSQYTCLLKCTHQHPIYKCFKFNKMDVQARTDFAKKEKLCLNCLSNSHATAQCQSKSTCRTCSRKHNSLLHRQESATAPSIEDNKVTNHHIQNDLPTALLATARVNIRDSAGTLCTFRALLDGGSSVSFITEQCARILNLKYKHSKIEVTGLQASSVGTSKGITSFQISPHFSSKSHNVSALIIPRITSKLPSTTHSTDTWSHLEYLTLADPEFNISTNVDLLLGADIFYSIILPEKITGPPGTPVALKSTLGYLIAGSCSGSFNTIKSFLTDVTLDKALERFWEIDTISESQELSSEEVRCDKHFNDTYYRDENGRFVVEMPLKASATSLGDSRKLAMVRLFQMEKKLTVHPNMDQAIADKRTYQRDEYNKFMQEYEKLGHMEIVTKDHINSDEPTYYIPHHFVEKKSSSTTKFRVVFDASARSSSGISLNDILMVGPVLQDSLFDIIVRFRTHPIAYTADIEKMYRQIKVNKKHLNLQRILWRENPNHPIKVYQLNTVTYGKAYSSYAATKCLKVLATDNQLSSPLAFEPLSNDFYMDDLMSGARTLEEGSTAVNQLLEVCNSGGFPLRKWSCNNKDLLAAIPPEFHETKSSVPVDEDFSIKTLGIFWNPCEDIYHFKINAATDEPTQWTKRTVLSRIAMIFDPFGWLAPTIIKAKILMQSMWKEQVDWDSALPEHLQRIWIEFKDSLPALEEIKIPRQITTNVDIISLHGFADASEVAYAAVVYTYTKHDNGPPELRLIASKTKVCPTQAVTLPRLELCAALLLSKLIKTLIRAMKVNINDIHCYTDSTITLAWIKSSPIRWKTFVKNRVQQIQNNVPDAKWFHIPGALNPADCASRGISARELINHPLWWNGTVMPSQIIPDIDSTTISIMLQEENVKKVTSHIQTYAERSIIHLFSKFNRLQRVMAWILRFINNCRIRKYTPSESRKSNPATTSELHISNKTVGLTPLTSSEISRSLTTIIKMIQASVFATEIFALKNGKPLQVNNKLLPLSPFVCPEGLLRVGGRLGHAQVSRNQKNPILLPRNHHFTNILITFTHENLLHAGPQSTQATLSRRYWIIRARDAVRFQLKKCITCVKQRASTLTQFMGHLPAARVNPAPVFSKCGVDYAGPFQTKPQGRSKISFKSYMAIFVCFSTKAVHLELVSSLSTDGFIAALRRFISRRGIPSDIFSDNGTNFIGAEKVIDDMYNLCSSKSHANQVSNECSKQGINFHFIPAGSPHFGGLWEAGVRSVKHHLKRVIGHHSLTFEEMTTLLTQIEAILNSRPITPSSNDPNDMEALTPAHFIIGRPLTSLPDQNLASIPIGRLDRWQHIQFQQQQFWKRWSLEYISRMQQRPKWMQVCNNIKLNDLVIIKDERYPPMKWKLGRVISLHPGTDNIVRVVTLRTNHGEIKRTINKLCLLPTDKDVATSSLQGPGECLRSKS